jgi:hypothetical protein
MAKSTDADEVAALRHEVADLKRRLVLLELFLDSEHRERTGTTLDEIRQLWRESRQSNGGRSRSGGTA